MVEQKQKKALEHHLTNPGSRLVRVCISAWQLWNVNKIKIKMICETYTHTNHNQRACARALTYKEMKKHMKKIPRTYHMCWVISNR